MNDMNYTIRGLKKVAGYISGNFMLEEHDNIIAGLSGGADSSCLLFLICRLIESGEIPKCHVHAIHINHGIRGEEAVRDENVSERFADSLGVNFKSYRFDVPALSKELGMSEEETGRKIRYESFRSFAREHAELTGTDPGKYKIAVAHNSNDRAETYIFNLVRGAGLRGLSGIKPVNGDIIRPILCLSRDEIEKICEENNISYVTDSTNSDDIYTRNYIRHRIIEPMSYINKTAVLHINEAADRAKEAYDYINNQSKEIFDRCCGIEYGNDNRISRVIIGFDVKNCDVVIRKSIYAYAAECLSGDSSDIYGTRFDAADNLLLNGTTGKSIQIGKGIVARLDYNELSFEYEKSPVENADAENDDCVYFLDDNTRKKIENGEIAELKFDKFALRLYKTEKVIKNDNECYTKYFDYDRIKGNLCFRKRRPHDVMTVGADGSAKKVKNLFRDSKVPKAVRDDIWILADDKACLWAVGVRQSVDSFVRDGLYGLCIEWIPLT